MTYLIFRGVSTASLGDVYIQKMPSHKKASMRYTEYKVKGRDGTLHVNEGFDNFDIMATLILVNATASKRQTVNAWADGTGKLILSDDLTKAYRASVLSEIVWTRDAAPGNKYFDIAKVTFSCEPFMYEAVESELEYTASATIVNPGSAEALPLIRVDGAGDASFTLNGETISIAGMVSGTPVFIDCETGYVYTQAGAATMTGEFPVLTYGNNALVIGSNVSKITITPRWRWV
jgi:phage-related protein